MCLFSWTGSRLCLCPDAAAALPVERPCGIPFPACVVQEDFSVRACQEKDEVENKEDSLGQAVAARTSLGLVPEGICKRWL